MKKQNKSPNLLDMVPCHNPKFRVETDAEGKVTIFMENKGPFNFIAQKVFRKPRFTQIHLEEFGGFIWKQMNGERTVQQIADLLHEEFGEKAEPLYPRITMYMKSLLDYEFVIWKKETK